MGYRLGWYVAVVKLVPSIRLQACNSAPLRPEGEFVLYWMIAFRRLSWNFALDRAVGWAKDLRKPLLILEPLRVDYPWASDRIHRFVIDGMAENASRMETLRLSGTRGVTYFPYVEPSRGAAKGLLERLAQRACVIVTDDCPAFFLPRMVAASAGRLPVFMEQVDANGLLPLRAAERAFPTAFSFRAFLRRTLPKHLAHFPTEDPLAGLQLPGLGPLPADLTLRWAPASAGLLTPGSTAELEHLPIDHHVGPVRDRGGSEEARSRLAAFIDRYLSDYHRTARHPDADSRSRLSPYLHFGHVSVHEIIAQLFSREPDRLKALVQGEHGETYSEHRNPEVWWGLGPGPEAWLDQLVTWRELGYNMAFYRPDYDRYESLPGWARATLEKHATDKRTFLYELEQFESASTHDEVWNAAQRQLLREGRIHNSLRMLWGKKILEWTASPREALAVMIELNNRFAVDGRDPNSYSGIFWCLGRYDRPWGPERPIFGTVRYMSSESARRKLRMKSYLERFRALDAN